MEQMNNRDLQKTMVQRIEKQKKKNLVNRMLKYNKMKTRENLLGEPSHGPRRVEGSTGKWILLNSESYKRDGTIEVY